MITALYNLFTMHNILPSDFFSKNPTEQRMLLAFSKYEVEKENANNK